VDEKPVVSAARAAELMTAMAEEFRKAAQEFERAMQEFCRALREAGLLEPPDRS